MEAFDAKPRTAATDARPAASNFDAWWAALSPEDQYHVIECVRLDEAAGLAELEARHPAPEALVARAAPTAALAEFVRRRPEYLERFAGADAIARHDDPQALPPHVSNVDSNVPDAHARTAPILPEPHAEAVRTPGRPATSGSTTAPEAERS